MKMGMGEMRPIYPQHAVQAPSKQLLGVPPRFPGRAPKAATGIYQRQSVSASNLPSFDSLQTHDAASFENQVEQRKGSALVTAPISASSRSPLSARPPTYVTPPGHCGAPPPTARHYVRFNASSRTGFGLSSKFRRLWALVDIRRPVAPSYVRKHVGSVRNGIVFDPCATTNLGLGRLCWGER